ncbi:MAG: SPASM domain-containing protein [Spirochaetia bacterium]
MSGTFSLVLRPTGDRDNVVCTYCSSPAVSTDSASGSTDSASSSTDSASSSTDSASSSTAADSAADPTGRTEVPRERPCRDSMSESLLEQIVATYMAGPQPVYRFAWEGGEPTLVGPAFFRKAMQLQKDHRQKGANVSNVIRTNATLIGDELAALFAEHNFAVDVTIDGPADLHDEVHSFESGGSPHEATMRGVELLRKHGIEPRASVSVTSANVHAPKRLYRYLKGKGFTSQQYVPRVDFRKDGSPQPWSVHNGNWGSFLKTLFDTWCADPQPASIQRFDAIMQRATGGVPAMCSLAFTCRQRFVIEPDGDVYPCEAYLNPEMKLGNVTTDSLEAMWNSEKFRSLGSLKRTLAEECESCPYKAYCFGDCPHNRFPGAGNPAEALSDYASPPTSVLCGAWTEFFSYALSDLEIQAHERI